MPFAAKSAAPLGGFQGVQHPVLAQASEERLTLFTAPAGYLLTDSLSATMAERDRPVMWLRLGPEDRDPGTFLLSLIESARRLRLDIGAATLEQMRRQPGPVMGWPPLFAWLARELAEALPASTAIVLENVHYLNGACPTLRLLGDYFLTALPASFTCILITPAPLPREALPVYTVQRSIRELRLDPPGVLALARHIQVDLSGLSLGRMIALTDGRAAGLAGLCAASAVLGCDAVRELVDGAANIEDLLTHLARAWLAISNADSLQALALTLRLEYSSPVLLQAVLGNKAPLTGPWLQSLADGWTRLRSLWAVPLSAALRVGPAPDKNLLHGAADYLASHEASERAVPLYLEMGEGASAAQVMAGEVDTLLDLGQWQTLNNWMSQLPRSSLYARPWLVYAEGEMAAAQGQVPAARRAFALAAELFTASHDADGACRSLLAESALAAWQDDRRAAQTRALAASAAAKAAGLTRYEGWAAWQLGCLAASMGELDLALVYFDQAATAASIVGDSLLLEYLRQVERLALRRRDLHRQREFHRQAYFATERAEHEAAEHLQRLLGAPPQDLDAMLNTHGWSRTPLMLKLPAPASPAEAVPTSGRANLWSSLMSLLRLRWPPPEKPTVPVPAQILLPQGRPGDAAPTASLPSLPSAPSDADNSALIEALPMTASAEDRLLSEDVLPPKSDNARNLTESGEQGPASQPIQAKKAAQAPTLTVHLLGPFRVAVNDQPVEKWPKGKGQAVFKYLLTHRDQPTPRDVLMEVFWPEAAPESARNRLNVALHSLRRALRPAADVPVILFEEGAYHLNPDLHLWLDVDEFERHVQAGQRLERTGQLAPATAEYEVAIGLYQGDFLADDPYEGWPVLTRERLRVAYLDTLDRLSQIYFGQGQYAACVTLCQLILARDNCREDAHCRLMRCYSRQGQPHLALRQYEACLGALRAELDVAPATATTQLYEQIRRREQV
jgi:DNA-binding SARP family transcriptional activator